MMSRVHKVIVGSSTIMANGGLITLSGAFPMAVAAKQFSIPFIVCCGLYKLTPLFSFD